MAWQVGDRGNVVGWADDQRDGGCSDAQNDKGCEATDKQPMAGEQAPRT